MQSLRGLREIQFLRKHRDIPIQPEFNSGIHAAFRGDDATTAWKSCFVRGMEKEARSVLQRIRGQSSHFILMRNLFI
jgi:hypothetical protein